MYDERICKVFITGLGNEFHCLYWYLYNCDKAKLFRQKYVPGDFQRCVVLTGLNVCDYITLYVVCINTRCVVSTATVLAEGET